MLTKLACNKSSIQLGNVDRDFKLSPLRNQKQSHGEYIKSLWRSKMKGSKTLSIKPELTKDSVKLLEKYSRSPNRIDYDEISIIASKRNCNN
jgi:hypothetical protein